MEQQRISRAEKRLRHYLNTGTSFATRKHSRVLHIEKLTASTFRVWGGENEHILRVVDGLPICDCSAFTLGATRACSHIYIWRVYMVQQGIMPKVTSNE